MPSPAWENCFRHFATPPPVSPRNDVRGLSAEIPAILMTWLYLDLGSTFDWLKQVSLAARPIRSTTQIWLVPRYGISALVSQASFGGETSGSTAKCLRLFQNPNALASWMNLVYLHGISILSKAQSCQLQKFWRDRGSKCLNTRYWPFSWSWNTKRTGEGPRKDVQIFLFNPRVIYLYREFPPIGMSR